MKLSKTSHLHYITSTYFSLKALQALAQQPGQTQSYSTAQAPRKTQGKEDGILEMLEDSA